MSAQEGDARPARGAHVSGGTRVLLFGEVCLGGQTLEATTIFAVLITTRIAPTGDSTAMDAPPADDAPQPSAHWSRRCTVVQGL